MAADIVESWRRPGRVMRRHLAAGQREDRALIYLMVGCALIGLSRLPRLIREIELGLDIPLQAGIGATILAWLFFMPLTAFFLAALSHLVARPLGGKGTWWGARLALFWSLLAAAPLWLLAGLADGFFGADAVLAQIVGAGALGLWAVIWLIGLANAEQGAAGA